MCKKIRESNGLSQYDMAILIGSNQTEVSFIERGFIPNDPKKIEKIQSFFQQL